MTARRLLTVYTIQVSLHWALYAALFPVHVLYMTSRGMSLLDIGLLVTIFSLTTLALEVPTGTLADQMGRKRIYSWSLVGQALAMVALLLARGFWGIALGNMLLGTARALASGTLDAWFVETLRRTDARYPLERAMAWVNGWMTTVLGVVTLAGGSLPGLAVPAWLAERLSSIYDINLLAVLGLIPVVWGYTMWGIHEPAQAHRQTSLATAVQRFPAMLAAVVSLASQRVLRVLLSTMAFAGFAYFAIENFWQPKLWSLMTDPIAQSWWLGVIGGLFFLANALGNMCSSWLGQLLARRHAVLMVMVFVGVGLLMVCVGWQTNPLMFAVLFCGHTFAWGLGEPVYERLFHDAVPDHLRSSLTSSQSLMMQIGGMTGGVCLGALADWQGLPLAWSLGGVVFAGSAWLFLLLHPTETHAHVDE